MGFTPPPLSGPTTKKENLCVSSIDLSVFLCLPIICTWKIVKTYFHKGRVEGQALSDTSTKGSRKKKLIHQWPGH